MIRSEAMKCKRRRCRALIIGPVATLCCLWLWTLSILWGCAYSGPALSVSLNCGGTSVWLYSAEMYEQLSSTDWLRRWTFGREPSHPWIRWMPSGTFRLAGIWVLRVPLWMPAIAALLWTAWTWRRDVVRTRGGRCRECGYDCAGVPVGSPCPECGNARSATGGKTD